MLTAGRLTRMLDGQRGSLILWTPVFYGTGIAAYLGLAREPGAVFWASAATLATAFLWRLRRKGLEAPLAIAGLCLLLRAAIAAGRTHSIAEPVLSFRYYGPIQGRIVDIDRSGSDKIRLTLDRVVLERVPDARTPARIRISLHGDQGFVTPEPGLTVILTGHLAPPGGPVEPGGFDFRRQAWFKRIGAVGYTRTPVLALWPAEEGHTGLLLFRLRNTIAGAVRATLPGTTGAFAAAVITGDRSGLDQPTLEAMRLSNLAHLLAISGLHMGMLTGFVFALVRYGLALVPWAALRWPLHKIGAVSALAAGTVYLGLSGGNVATERAYIMVAVMFAAVLFDRRALTLRSVALAALIVLTLRPEAILGPGFQMSFAATTALVAAFGALRNSGFWRLHPVLRWVGALALSSLVAGLATAPIAAAHFNRVPHFGLIANLLAVPAMGAVVVPGAVAAALLAPLGLGEVGLRIMALGIDWILAVAHHVASLDGTVSHVATPAPAILPLLTLGALFTVLWTTRLRWAGILPAMAALALWAMTERPGLLIAADGGLIGLLAEEGRSLSKPRGGGFAAETWLENDGDGATQGVAAARSGLMIDKGHAVGRIGPFDIHHLWGRGAEEAGRAACARNAILVTSAPIAPLAGPCRVIDPAVLAETGALALYLRKETLIDVPTYRPGAHRPWAPRPVSRP
ncbi:ComEC/Rec2 family competence protein [Ovoidimarina sediminis]|uniref:ComEC/Rec2 family competence protein n=1 Tax=Ovoidimarina sediminis TaxID=3079856 RepID=UPI00291228B2|nr:ComEC/Rec2 family competence protein [Rhodophyticola sp. MJ-SS7]MDU8943898.1 ComEC/Rec2 family competence protein [Rhodophyticola sp. MJ-SS7]